LLSQMNPLTDSASADSLSVEIQARANTACICTRGTPRLDGGATTRVTAPVRRPLIFSCLRHFDGRTTKQTIAAHPTIKAVTSSGLHPLYTDQNLRLLEIIVMIGVAGFQLIKVNGCSIVLQIALQTARRYVGRLPSNAIFRAMPIRGSVGLMPLALIQP
jgi:hypothetical protein